MTGSHEVRGSIPLSSTTRKNKGERFHRSPFFYWENRLFFLPGPIPRHAASLSTDEKETAHLLCFSESAWPPFGIFRLS